MEQLNLDRRTFVKAAGSLGALSVAGMAFGASSNAHQAFAVDAQYPEQRHGKPLEAQVDPKTGEVTINEDVIIRYGACLACYSSCGNRVKLDRATGSVLSVGGNPYNPNNAYPYLNFTAPLSDAYRSMSQAPGYGNITRGTLCGRGLGSWDGYNQPDRIVAPLKRAGKRGEGKWKTITWDQLIKEVTEGGKLFADIGEDTNIEGFLALHDTTTPMNPDSPEYGPVSNQLVELGGRGDGRSVINSRFLNSFGSINVHSHGSSCGGAKNTNVFKTGTRDLRSDIEEAEYILWIGCFPGSNGKSYQGIAKRCVEALSSDRCKMDVVDPVLGNGCVTPAQKNITWHPIKTATNTAFALGMIRWMIDNAAYNAQYLAIPNYTDALAAGYASFSNASHLVIVDETHANKGKLMRAADAGITPPETTTSASSTTTVEHYVVIDAQTGGAAANRACSEAQIEFEGEVNGVKVRSAFMFLKDAALEHTVAQWAEICDVEESVVTNIAREFTSHGTKASATGLGSTATINGLDSACIYHVLDSMIGSDQMKGGMAPRRVGGKTTVDGDRYKLATIKGKPDVSTKTCTYISRTNRGWETTSEYKRRVAAGEVNPQPKLPWYALPTNSDNQALVSIVHCYPYQAKILISWMVNTLQATPGALRDEIIDRLKDPAIVPLHIACDVVLGEHANLADYVIPDTNPYESFGVVTNEGYWCGKGNTVRWPTVTPQVPKLADGRYMSYEAFCADVARVCKLPGWGDEAIEDANGTMWPLNDACDYFLKAVANLAYDTTPVDDVSTEDVRLQALDELPDAWKAAVSAEEWPKVQNVLSRGGRFWPIDIAYEGERSKFATEFMVNIYFEKRALAKSSATGENWCGTMHWTPELFDDKTALEDRYDTKAFPLKSTNYKPRFRSTTMLANSPIMRDLCKENYLEINLNDAKTYGIADGDTIRITSSEGDVMEGKAMVRGGIAQGTFGVAWGYGHIAYGAQSVTIDDATTPGNPDIGAGVHLKNILDPTVKDAVYPISDPEAASPGRCGGFYKIEKA